MAFHLGKKELIANLSSDVRDIEHSLRHLLKTFPAAGYPPRLQSWKYPGTSYLDVDTHNLINCFRYNSRSQDESKKSHLILTELLIDRLIAFLFVCTTCMEQQIIASGRNNLLLTSPSVSCIPMAFTVDCARRAYMAFLISWGIGIPEAGPPVDADTQTTEEFRPHTPCPDCPWKTSWTDALLKTVCDTVGCRLSDLSSEKNQQLLQKVCTSAVTDFKNVPKKVLAAEKRLKETTVDVSERTSSVHKLQGELELLKKQLLEMTDNKRKNCETKQDLENETTVEQETGCKLKEDHGTLGKSLENVVEYHAELEKQLLACEVKARSRQRVYQLGSATMREKNTILLENVARAEEKCFEIEKIYDPLWETKIRTMADQAKSLSEQWSDSESLRQFNENRLADLKDQLNVFTQKSSDLRLELKLLTAT